MKKLTVKLIAGIASMFIILHLGTVAYNGLTVATEKAVNSVLGQYGVEFNITSNNNNDYSEMLAEVENYEEPVGFDAYGF